MMSAAQSARAIRRIKQRRGIRPDRFFEEAHIPSMAYAIEEATQKPVLLIIVKCSADAADAYFRRLESVTDVRLRTLRNAVAIDLFADGDSVGRLTTNFGNPSVESLIRNAEDEVGITLGHDHPNGRRDMTVRLPFEWETVTPKQFHGSPVEHGSGEHAAVNMDMHDGAIHYHRFETREEAEVHNRRISAEGRPFIVMGVT